MRDKKKQWPFNSPLIYVKTMRIKINLAGLDLCLILL